jgi:hypothetical protein
MMMAVKKSALSDPGHEAEQHERLLERILYV